MAICEYCNKKLEKNRQGSQMSLIGHYTKCVSRLDFIDDQLSKNFLQEEYTIKRKSAKQIADETNFKITAAQIIRRLRKYNIELRSISEAKKEKLAINRGEQTNLKKHGSRHNFCKEHPSRVAWEEKMFLEEGIKNVFQRPDIINLINAKLATDHEFRKIKFGNRISIPHRKVYNHIKDVYSEKMILEYNANPNIRKYYDIWIPNHNLIIEVNGDLFHANPRKYKADDVLHFQDWGEGKNATSIWQKDKEKLEIAINLGHHVLIIWEYDIKRNWEDVVELINRVMENVDDCKNQICEESREYIKAV